ncbi:variant erythrocyte surface antigen-1 family protein [Babesia caballi]|uniref:Variant erythrocyte surface antigen-1 family protein n=1 Tax=Babesia caballi TaxID=5871 RepID=A0AAV4M1K3_BABCB|nr:variant erythrocyte surface antigen-1 family protein [Babesia caballi]
MPFYPPLLTPLLDRLSNLKEAIDWILRLTGKDGQGGSDGGTAGLASAVIQLLEGVKSTSSELQDQFEAVKTALIPGGTNALIDNLATGLATFIGYQSPGRSNEIGTVGIAVKGDVRDPNDRGPGYKLTYDRTQATWDISFSSDSYRPTAAKIFLGCVPLCFYGLSYLYWRCDIKGNGEWKTSTLTTGHLGYFMNGQGFNSKQLSGKLGTQVVTETMKDKFDDFKEGISTAKGMAGQRANKEAAAQGKLGIGDAYVPDFRTGTPSTKVAANKNPTYPEYLHALCGKLCNGPSAFTPSDDKPLSSIYYICRLYFQGKQKLQSDLPNLKPRPPSTIREMIYFLAALPFSANYGALDTYISDHFKSLVKNAGVKEDYELMIPVADSSSPNTNNTLSAADLKDYLTTTCLYCPTILGRFQGNSADSKESGEPWLHRLFSNTQFSLEYPAAGPTLFNALANYAYALQFQLSFLYQQCSLGATQGCCWRQCRYGQSINKRSNSQIVQSHICPVKCNQAGHDTGNHPQNCDHKRCGEEADKRSPLQAFLTDNLRGFSLPQNPDSISAHLDNHPSGSMCHVKMGFQSTDLRSSGSGHYIYYTLDHFCGFSNDPLRQLCEKLACLTKRMPRTLGDMFGFIWHLNGQLFHNTRPEMADLIEKLATAFNLGSSLKDAFTSDPYSVIVKIWNKIREIKSKPSSHTKPSSLSLALAAMAPAIPFLYQLFMMENSESLPGKLYDLRGSSHNGSRHNDLVSLRNTVCNDANCGPYLYPLTHSEGSAFASSHASTYLSWLVYLTDEFRDSFQNLLDELTNMTCSAATGCKSCNKNHGSGPSSCSCDSIAQCGGVLPLLYGNGFQFDYPYTLNGWKYEGDWKSNTQSKRNYEKFSTQLSNVLSPDAPLAKLLLTIDDFLYMFRFYFFYNLSSFWLCSLLILLYFIFYGIDVLHFKSHVHLPSSHTVPPIGLLTTGKPTVLKDLTKLTYFMP